jgi:hypothetical protein
MAWMAGARRGLASRTWRPRAYHIVLTAAHVGDAVIQCRRFAGEQHKGSGAKGGTSHGCEE